MPPARRHRTRTLLSAVALASLLALGCGQSNGPVSKSADSLDVTGAGASFPYPLFSKWMYEYHRLKPQVRVSYQSIGSGGGIRQVLARTIDFGATDTPMTADELARARGTLVHIPVTLGAVAVVYHLDGVDQLRFSPTLLANIFGGTVSRWNAPEIAALNPNAQLPDREITIVYRSDGSGTTAAFTNLLASVSETWRTQVGRGKAVRFPTGLGAKGNEGVAGTVKTTPGTLGYVELSYAVQSQLPFAAIRNRDGEFVQPSVGATTAAAESLLGQIPDDLRMTVTNAPGAGSYPIISLSYVLVYRDTEDRTKARALVDFLWWAVHDGQQMAPPLHYAPLPATMVARIETALERLTAGGQPVLGN